MHVSSYDREAEAAPASVADERGGRAQLQIDTRRHARRLAKETTSRQPNGWRLARAG